MLAEVKAVDILFILTSAQLYQPRLDEDLAQTLTTEYTLP